MEEKNISLRRLSLETGKYEGYYQYLLVTAELGPQALPSPDDLRQIQPILGDIPLATLFELAWGITPAAVDEDLAAVAAHSGVCAETHGGLTSAEFAGFTPREVEEIRNFLGYVRARREQRRLAQATTRGRKGSKAPEK